MSSARGWRPPRRGRRGAISPPPRTATRNTCWRPSRRWRGLPGLAGLYDPHHNPLFRLPLGRRGDRAVRFFREREPATGALVHDFTDPDWDTRFLGDLYQDLSEDARKRYALLQTPEFVEEFILDRTLDPAIASSASRGRMIDPTCGSGHFLLGGSPACSGNGGATHRTCRRRRRAEGAGRGGGRGPQPLRGRDRALPLLVAALKAAGEHAPSRRAGFPDQPRYRRQPAARAALLPAASWAGRTKASGAC